VESWIKRKSKKVLETRTNPTGTIINVTRFIFRLSQRRDDEQTTTMTTGGVNAAPKWIDSRGKQLLLQDLLSGRISLISPREWTAKRDCNLADRPQFRLYPYNNFVTNFRNLRKKILQETVSSATDSHALAHDRSIHPVAPFNQLGEPRWEGSLAQKLLSADIDDAKHTRMKPHILHGTREEYGYST
jgi:hypothetical protein